MSIDDDLKNIPDINTKEKIVTYRQKNKKMEETGGNSNELNKGKNEDGKNKYPGIFFILIIIKTNIYIYIRSFQKIKKFLNYV